MKSRVWLMVVVCLAAVTGDGAVGLRLGWAQDPSGDNPFAEKPRTEAPLRRAKTVERRVEIENSPWRAKFRFAGPPNAMPEIQKAAKALHEAKDANAKEAADKKLTALLDEYFDEDMKRREEELASIEERLKNLRAVLEKRRAKQSEIVELQKKVLLNEADDLGFFTNTAPGHPTWQVFDIQGGEGGDVLKGAPVIVAPVAALPPTPPTPPAPPVKAKPAPRPTPARGATSSATWIEEREIDASSSAEHEEDPNEGTR